MRRGRRANASSSRTRRSKAIAAIQQRRVGSWLLKPPRLCTFRFDCVLRGTPIERGSTVRVSQRACSSRALEQSRAGPWSTLGRSTGSCFRSSGKQPGRRCDNGAGGGPVRFADKELRRCLDHQIELSQRQDSYAATGLPSTFTEETHRPSKRPRSREIRDLHVRFAHRGTYLLSSFHSSSSSLGRFLGGCACPRRTADDKTSALAAP